MAKNGTPLQVKPDRAAKARAALMHRTNLKLAARLRDHGWICIEPGATPNDAPARATEQPAPTTIPLTQFQAEEVRGLLDVCADEAETSGDRLPWGSVTQDGRRATLIVLNIVEAESDLRDRADYLEAEGATVGAHGAAGSRSLRDLAQRIRAAGQGEG